MEVIPVVLGAIFFFFSSRRRHTRLQGDWSSDVCSSDLVLRRGGIYRLREVAADLDRQAVAPGIRDARAAAERVLEKVQVVEAPVRAEAAELDALRALRQGGMRHHGCESHQENQPLHRDSSHGPRYGAANRTALNSSLKVPCVWPRNWGRNPNRITRPLPTGASTSAAFPASRSWYRA